MISMIFLTILWFATWMLLTWPPEPKDAYIGAGVAVFVTFMTSHMFSKNINPFRRPSRYVWFIYYAVVFLWECVKANLDVAYRVIHPDLPIRPGTIRVRTSLKSDSGLTFLANSITLTPGTTSIDIDKERGILYVHWIYVKEGFNSSKDKLAVVDKFERILKRIFE